jgi:endoglucanase
VDINNYRLKINFKKRFITIVLISILINCLGYSFLKRDKKNIVDSKGNPILLKGIGLGGWLVPEGYMLQTPGFGSPDQIRDLVRDVIGEANTDEFFKLYRKNFINEQDIKIIKEAGFNSIRLPFDYQILSPKDKPGVYLDDGFAIIDSLLAWCKKNNIYLILDMHCAPGGQNSGNISNSDGIAKLWTIPANQDRTIDIWRRIVERYKNEEWVGGYDLLNEPVLPDGYSNTVLRNFYARLCQSIREIDTNHIVFIEGNWYATDFSNIDPSYDNNIAYSFHKYWNDVTYGSINSYLFLRATWEVPLWMGESGENSNTWFYNSTKLYKDNNIGWCWWTYKKISTTNALFSVPLTANYQKVLDYWKSNTNKPTVDFAKAALFEMANNLLTEKCEYKGDMVTALMDSEFGTKAKPFKNLVIPGTINCVDYDLGVNGIAYSDKEFQNIGSGVQTNWNLGGAYRNDGVDIEKSKDIMGCEYAVGWIEKDEWLRYTITTSRDANHNIFFRVANPSGSGKIALYLDDQILATDITFPKTTGYYDWAMCWGPNVFIPAGVHSLKMLVLNSGFNINQMIFIQTSTKVDEQNIVKEFKLHGNYPNPFNPSTVIKYQMPAGQNVKITIYNLLGQEIKTLVNEFQSMGEHSINFDATGFPGGVYLIKFTAGKYIEMRKMMFVK